MTIKTYLAVILLLGTSPVFPGDFTQYVDMFLGVKAVKKDGTIGSSGGNSVVGPHAPWGSIHPSPNTENGATDAYHPDKPILGFSQMHVSGTGGRGNYGFFFLAPQPELNTGVPAKAKSEKANEVARPYFYGVDLLKHNIRVELAPTRHSVIYRIEVPANSNVVLPINMAYSTHAERPGQTGRMYRQGAFSITSNTLQGWGTWRGGWSNPELTAHVYAEIKGEADAFGLWENDSVTTGPGAKSFDRRKKEQRGEISTGGFFRFTTEKPDTLYIKMAVSMKSSERAKEYLQAEIPGWDFERVKEETRDEWNRELSRIDIETSNPNYRNTFYSCFRMTMVMPRDRTGDNPAWESEAPYYDDHYTLWDTWHTLFPLMGLTMESRYRDIVLSMLDVHEQIGEIPDAFIGGRKGKNQGGANSWNILTDAYLNRIPGIDWNAAYDAMDGRPAGNPAEKSFAYYCKGLMATELGKAAEAKSLFEKSENEWDKKWNENLESRGFKGFLGDEDPEKWQWYETNSWAASFGMPHDFTKLAELMGGSERAVERLEYGWEHDLFLVPYGLGNQPVHKIPLCFTGFLRPDRTSFHNRNHIIPRVSVDPYKYIGNDDSGSNSSRWMYTLAGIFPLAGQGIYMLHGPAVDKVVFHSENSGDFTIEGVNVSPENIYVQSATLDGVPLSRAWLHYHEVLDAENLTFVMGPEPSRWGTRTPVPTMSQLQSRLH